MILQKWNYKTHSYNNMRCPIGWNCKTYSDDMEEIVNCPHCGKKIKFGETFTSLEFHTGLGMGYGVCEECYEKERERRRKYESEESI